MIALHSLTTATFVHVERWWQQELAHCVRSLEQALHMTQQVGRPENMALSEVIQTRRVGTRNGRQNTFLESKGLARQRN